MSVVVVPVAASAHVKWFAPYIVGAAPAPITRTLTDLWFWAAIALVLVFLLATRLFERSTAGQATLDTMDRVTNPFWLRLDDFVRIMIAGFFVAIFAVGGIYLTPDRRCCTTLSMDDSHRESMRLDMLYDEALTLPLSHDELVQLHSFSA